MFEIWVRSSHAAAAASGLTDAEAEADAAHRRREAPPLGRPHALRVIEPEQVDPVGQDHGGGHDGTGQRTHPDLVDPGDPRDPLRSQRLAPLEQATQPL